MGFWFVDTAGIGSVIAVGLGLSARYPRHRRIARWTLPLWLYVSLTGVVVYALLYRLSW